MDCLHCKTTIRNGERFCTNCGLAVTANTKAATSASTPLAEGAVADNGEMTVVRSDRLIGRVLDDKYELLSRLGEGGMSTVYRARRVHIGDEVAVKVLRRNHATEANAVERFRREARAAAMLRHPNVVTIHDYSEARGEAAQAYIVMELAPGAPLDRILKLEGRLPMERAVALMSGICAGVGAAHRQGIVHRDLKPGNIIVAPPESLGEAETVKIVDFGIAKLRDSESLRPLTQSGTLIGTPYYMSPEQGRGWALDARSDVYGLGLILYEMLAGVRPFTAPTPTGVIARHLTEAPPPLSQHLGIPSGVEAVLMRALAKDPNVRPADATAFSRELQAALSFGNRRALTDAAPAFSQLSGRTTRYALIAAIILLSIGAGARTWLAQFQQPETNLKSASVVKNVAVNRNSVSEAPASGVKAQPIASVVSDSRSRPSLPKTTATPRGAHRDRPGSGSITAVKIMEGKHLKQLSKKVEKLPPEIRGAILREVLTNLASAKTDGKVTVIYTAKKRD